MGTPRDKPDPDEAPGPAAAPGVMLGLGLGSAALTENAMCPSPCALVAVATTGMTVHTGPQRTATIVAPPSVATNMSPSLTPAAAS